MKTLGHEMILASAGSGKTYTLTNRYVQLLARDVKPERVVALTFTRKAAGEFFDKILGKLADAATDAELAARLAGEIGVPGKQPADFLRMLRSVADAMPRLTLGTFDSFFARIVRAFPLELGLGGDFELLEENAAVTERRRVLRSIFDDAGRGTRESQLEFIEAFKRSTFGLEEKRLSSLLDKFINENHRNSLIAPDPDVWGNPARIWPGGSPWSSGIELGTAVASLRSVVRAMSDLKDGQRARFEAFFEAAGEWTPGTPLPGPIEYILKNTLSVWADLCAGAADVTIDRKRVTFAGPACQALRAAVGAIVDAEMQRRIETTRGIFDILQRYERIYDRTVRRSGHLTFSDIERILTPNAGAPALAQGINDEAVEEKELRRLFIDWRLDGRFDHWLLDEFQDTSHGQWSALRNLIDEVVQDASGQRTFFFVGDVKQAIYGWRGGDSRLFREISDHYNAGGEQIISEKPLDESYRSSVPVLEMVNTIFSDAGTIGSLFPRPTADRWNREWRPHSSAHPEYPGHAAWLLGEDMDDYLAITLRLIREIDPLRRGLSVAVLTQSNANATIAADYLRREGGIAAMAESDLLVCTDNPATAAMLALFQAAAHPQDTLAWKHLRFTPLGEILHAENAATPEALSFRLLATVHADGFEHTVESWWQKLETRLDADDIFTRIRGQQMMEAARLFDETRSRDFSEFIEFMQRHSLRDTEAAGVVRVMTIHKSKGLGFDLVILPELDGQSLAKKPQGLTVHRNEDRSVGWVLDLPAQLFYSADPVLSAHVEEAAADTCYDRLALLYVAMTRARHGLYAIAKAPGEKSRSANYPALLGRTLGADETALQIGAETFATTFSAGDANWFASIEPPAATIERPIGISPLSEDIAQPVQRFIARRPSAGKALRISGETLFAPTEKSAVAHGSAVHEALALVEWWDPAQSDAWVAAMKEKELPQTAITEARSCLESGEIGALFHRPAASRAEVWRERMFEIILGDEWITGVFDRVVIHRDASGKIASVDIFDFKTDRVGQTETKWAQAAEHYRDQMQLYRRAAAILTAVPESRVSITIVLTRPIDRDGGHAPPQTLAEN